MSEQQQPSFDANALHMQIAAAQKGDAESEGGNILSIFERWFGINLGASQGGLPGETNRFFQTNIPSLFGSIDIKSSWAGKWVGQLCELLKLQFDCIARAGGGDTGGGDAGGGAPIEGGAAGGDDGVHADGDGGGGPGFSMPAMFEHADHGEDIVPPKIADMGAGHHHENVEIG